MLCYICALLLLLLFNCRFRAKTLNWISKDREWKLSFFASKLRERLFFFERYWTIYPNSSSSDVIYVLCCCCCSSTVVFAPKLSIGYPKIVNDGYRFSRRNSERDFFFSKDIGQYIQIQVVMLYMCALLLLLLLNCRFRAKTFNWISKDYRSWIRLHTVMCAWRNRLLISVWVSWLVRCMCEIWW